MRVLFLTLYPESMASPRYRVHQFLPYLREHGVQCTVACPFTESDFTRFRAKAAQGRARSYHLHEARVRFAQILSARRFDLVFLQKAVSSAYFRGWASLLRHRARRLIYDLDDAVNLAPPNSLPARWAWLEDREQTQKLFRSADLLLAGNAWLQNAARDAGARAELFPTVVDTDRFVPGAMNTEKFVLGWMGSPSTSENLAPLAVTLNALDHSEVHLIGADPARAGVARAQHRPWRYETEVAELQQLSVGLMPLNLTDWDRGKCGLKALQYMACGVPCVATRCDVTRDLIDDGVNGLLAETADEWAAALTRLRDVAFRRQLGVAARRAVESRFSLKAAAPKLLAYLEAVVR